MMTIYSDTLYWSGITPIFDPKRALSKPPQRRQGPDLRPLWLLVGTPSAIRPELAFSRAEHSLPYSDVTIYIFAILYLSSMPYV